LVFDGFVRTYCKQKVANRQPYQPYILYFVQITVQYNTVQQLSNLQSVNWNTEADFLDVIGTKVLTGFLLAIYSHLY
jgi:hypothetical protein